MDTKKADMELAVADYLIATRCILEDGPKVREAFLAGIRWQRVQAMKDRQAKTERVLAATEADLNMPKDDGYDRSHLSQLLEDR